MLKEHASAVRRLLMAADACLIMGAFVCAYWWVHGFRALFPFRLYLLLMPPFIAAWLLLLHRHGLYESFRLRSIRETSWIILKTAAGGFLGVGCAIFIFQWVHFSRIFIAAAFTLIAGALILERTALILLSRASRRRGYNHRNLLVVGTGRRAEQFITRVHRHAEWGLRIIGMIDEDPVLKGRIINGHEVLGTFDDLLPIIHNTVVDEVVFVVPRTWLPRIEALIHLCEMEGIQVSLAADFFDLKLSRSSHTDLAGLPILRFATTPTQVWSLVAKRVLDVVVAGVSLVALSPILLDIALLVRLTSRGPVFFRQQRCGLNGRRFTLYKFRTMVQDAEAQLPRLMAKNEMDGPVFKLTKDPRITGIGRFLRRTSLDELPQLWNVLRGEMSLVGPRPPLPVEVQRYDNWQRRKLSMRPGITCLWQVNGRNNIKSFQDWGRMDLHYIDHWSLGLDWKILCKTLPVVMFGIGAK
jgi:exopolysaccharide biosynthesis polyprenyl glycosylphosphotransferase